MEAAFSPLQVDEKDKIFTGPFLLNAYNKPKASDNLLAKIFTRKIKSDNDSLQFYLHKTAYDNKVKLNDYRSAYATSQLLLTKFAKFINLQN